MAKYVLAIDQGTTSSRAILFDKDGQPKAMHQQEFPQHHPQPGWTEHDPEEIYQSVMECCEGALKKASASKSDIAAIGITNQRETTVVWDKETGKALYKAIVWLDLRTSETVAKLSKGGSRGKDRFRRTTGLPVSTYFSAVKMKWMIDNVPEVKAACDAGKCCFGTIESWLIYKLTGSKDGGIFITDVCNASRYMLMNIKTLQWDESVAKTIGIPLAALPEIKSNSEVYGHVKGGLLDGLPISGSLGDQHAALLGQGCLEAGSSKNTYGTGCFMLLNTGLDDVFSRAGLLTTIGFKLGAEADTYYALEGSIACAGKTVQWLRDNMGIISKTAEVETLAEAVSDTGGVTLVSAFSGLFAPHWRPDARAVAVGMTLYTRKEHICRAALESVAFQTVDVMHAMQKDTGLKLKGMRVDGGMTANNLLMQMQADLLGVDVLRAVMPEATALGAAFAAGLAVKFYSSKEQIQDMLKTAGGHESFGPKITKEVRSREHARWKDALQRAMDLERWGKGDEEKVKPLKAPRFRKVAGIKPEQEGLNLMLKMVEKPNVTTHEEYHDVVCGDASGMVTLHLRPRHFLPCEVGQYIRVQNAYVRMKNGHIRVEVDKWGKVAQAEPEAAFEINKDFDVSAVEYELAKVP